MHITFRKQWAILQQIEVKILGKRMWRKLQFREIQFCTPYSVWKMGTLPHTVWTWPAILFPGKIVVGSTNQKVGIFLTKTMQLYIQQHRNLFTYWLDNSSKHEYILVSYPISLRKRLTDTSYKYDIYYYCLIYCGVTNGMNECQVKPKYLESTCASTALSIAEPT